MLRGRVVIRAPSSEGKEVILKIISEGEIFGEIALLDGKERTADATAMTDCELLVVARRSFLSLLERPVMTRELLNVLCERLRRTSEQVEDLMFLDVEARIGENPASVRERRRCRHTIELSRDGPRRRHSTRISQRRRCKRIAEPNPRRSWGSGNAKPPRSPAGGIERKPKAC